MPDQALPAAISTLLDLTRALDLRSLDGARGSVIKDGPLGSLAAALRALFCGGESVALLRMDMLTVIYEAFACLEGNGPRRTIASYKAWVERLGKNEYADELVIVAVARELKIRIVCVPYTPQEAPLPWAVSTYPNTDAIADDDCTILLGNNDVHYMWLDRML